MNDVELDQKLKAAREPGFEPDYVADFPRMVLANLRREPRERIQPAHHWPRFAWGLTAIMCVMLAFAAGRWHGRPEAGQDILASSKLIEETQAVFPNRVRAIVRDENGMKVVLSEEANMPASTPIYVRICDGKNCSSLVTFSGQEIQFAGQEITVLSDASGGIILEGNAFAWSSSVGGGTAPGLKIQAKLLQAKVL